MGWICADRVNQDDERHRPLNFNSIQLYGKSKTGLFSQDFVFAPEKFQSFNKTITAALWYFRKVCHDFEFFAGRNFPLRKRKISADQLCRFYFFADRLSNPAIRFIRPVNMKKSFFLPLFILFLATSSSAQNLHITGIVVDATQAPLIGANVSLLQASDTTLLTGTQTETDGSFDLGGLRRGKYLVRISYIGFEDQMLMADLRVRTLDLGKLVLAEKASTLKEVTVSGKLPPVQQKGDTTQFNANAYKVNPDANAEDLVTKMPGISVQDGKVQAQGEDVKEVLVDGRKFFGDDANAVLKNLPAEIIDKIQVFDKKSEQSELTGIDDGNTTKSINIVTRNEFRNGTFGRAFAGYGNEERWKAGMNLNFFEGKKRITLLANTNNINEQNFSSEDLAGVMSSSSNRGGGGRPRGGGHGGGGWRPGGFQNDASNFLVDQRNGITETKSFGINYANGWDKVELTGSYFFNNTQNNAETDLFRQYLTAENEGLTYQERKASSSTNRNHRLNMRLEWKIDSLRTFYFQPRVSVQQNDGRSAVLGDNILLNDILSSTSNDYSSDVMAYNFSLPLSYRHSFRKRGRVLFARASATLNENDSENNLATLTSYYDIPVFTDTLDQYSKTASGGFSTAAGLNFTEPLSQKSRLQFRYDVNYNRNDSDKATYNYTAADDTYSAFDTSLSNKFDSRYLAHAWGSSYSYNAENWNVTAGLAYQVANLANERIFPIETNLDKNFYSILPNAMFQYRFTEKKNLRLFYRSSNNAPSVNQLQDVINNSNPLQLSAGNPNLKQDWQNSVNLRYSAVNTDKNTSLFLLVGGTFTGQYIANSTLVASADTLLAPDIVLARGSQFSQPVNLDGYFSLRTFGNYSLPLGFMKTNLNLNASASLTRTPGLINRELNEVDALNTGFGLALSSNISEKFDFYISTNTSFNSIENTLQPELNTDYFNQNSRLRVQVNPWKGLVFQTEMIHQYNSGLSADFNQDYLLWNAAIAYKFLKKREAELRLSVFDILKQNLSISRNTTDVYYEDVRTDVLQQYFMLTFSYNIRYFKEGKVK